MMVPRTRFSAFSGRSISEEEYALIKLRVSVARVAQALKVDNDLGVTDKSYAELWRAASFTEHGWNNLLAKCAQKAEDLLAT